MPFASRKQERSLFSQHPDVARKFVADAKAHHQPMIRAADLDMQKGPEFPTNCGNCRAGIPHMHVADMDLAEYRRQLAAAYHEMTRKPAAERFGDKQLDDAVAAYQANPNAPGAYAALHQAQVAADTAAIPAAAPAPMNAPQGPTALPDTTDQPWMQNYAPAPLAGTPATGISPAEERAEVAQGRKQEAAEAKAAADAKKPKPVDAGKLGLATDAGSGETKPEAGGSRPQYDVSLVPRAQTVTRAASETPTLDPGRIAQLDKDQQSIIGAQNEMGQAQDQAVRAQADAAQQKSQLLAEQQADMLRKAQERDAYLQRQEQHITELSNDVAKEKVDPWKNKTGWDRARYALAAALGGFVSGFRGTPNYAMQEINTQLNREMEIQREEIERKKGKIGDAQGVLANAYRRFGNLDQAEAASRAVALQQLDAEQQAWAARNGDPVQMAKSKLLSQQMRLDADKYKASLFQYRPATTAQVGGISAAQQRALGELAAKVRSEAAQNGHDITPEEARRQAAATMGLTAGTGYADISKAPKGGQTSQKDAENLRAHEAAISYIDKMIDMRKANNGGSFSPTDKKVAAGYAARAQENLVAALGKTNKGLLDRTEKLIPDDPLEHNVSGVVGADPTMAQLEAAKSMLQEEQARITQQPGTPGSAGSEELPQGEPEED